MGTSNSYNKFILILFVAGLVILLGMHGYIYFTRDATSKSEGFAEEYVPNMRACPGALNEFTTADTSDCCLGPVENGKCKGTPACTLSSKSGKLPRCVNWVSTYVVIKGVEVCPLSMPLYYETKVGGFCTASQLKRDISGPQDKNAKSCRVYGDVQNKLELEDSCYNVRRLDDMKIPPGATLIKKELFQREYQGKKFIIPFATYNDANGEVKTCLDRTSLENEMDFKNPTWRSDPAIVKRINDQSCI